MLAGPMDFTPGVLSLKGRNGQAFQSTMMKQLAQYVVLYSPIQMAADLSENYAKYPDAFQFIKDVPVDWQQTRALQGEIGDFSVIARQDRNSENWFVGGVSDENPRALTLNLDFLAPGKRYLLTLYRDADEAHYASKPFAYTIEKRRVQLGDRIPVTMAAGGGFAASLVLEN